MAMGRYNPDWTGKRDFIYLFYIRRNYHIILTPYLGDQWSNFAHHYHKEGRRVAPI